MRTRPMPPTTQRQSCGGWGRSRRGTAGNGIRAVTVRPMDGPVVELAGAVAVRGSFPALAGASIIVERGEIVLLRGPNGAGKTTMLRVCAGLVPLVRGTGTVLGCDLATRREEVRRR